MRTPATAGAGIRRIMFHVISEQTPRGPIYLVEDTITKSRKRGSFDCERSAQAFADYLNQREDNNGDYPRKILGTGKD